MRTYLDCIPCFFRQALDGCRIVNAGAKVQKQIIDEFARMIPRISLDSPPPEIARFGYSLLTKLSGDKDPYQGIKQKSNRLALRVYGKLKNKVAHSKDRLLTALEIAIAGNIIDFGVKNNLNISRELKKILAREEKYIRRKTVFHYLRFKRDLAKAKSILYLADNAGETVFDRILIEEIKRRHPGKEIYFAVKDKPVINDALLEDAEFCGIDKLAKVISSGSDAPGTILKLCNNSFKRIYRSADMIISKGQGNFESLSQEKRPIFFLFMVKCQVVAKHTGCKLGDIVLYHNSNKTGPGLKRKRRLKAVAG